MMESVVTGGTATNLASSGLDLAGKTGTAETGVNGKYDTWFIAFAPANDAEGRRRRRAREPDRLRRDDGRSDREVDRAGGSRLKGRIPRDRADGHNRPTPEHAVRRALPHHAQARRRAEWRTSTSPRTRSSAAASRSRSSTTATRATSSSSSASAARRRTPPSLSHPNIVSIYDRGEAEGTYYIAMEYLDGRSLKELILSRGPAPMSVAVDYARQILSALRFAHRNGIVHRDIKPHNVLVDPRVT